MEGALHSMMLGTKYDLEARPMLFKVPLPKVVNIVALAKSLVRDGEVGKEV